VKTDGGPWTIPEAVAAIGKAGYTGIEAPIKVALDFGKKEFCSLLQDHNLKYIPMVFSSGPAPVVPGADSKYPGHPKPGRSVDQHFDVWRAQVEESLSIGSAVALINCHSGSDYFKQSESEEFFRRVLEVEKNISTVITHETHRGRVLYSPWVARALLPNFPHLRLTADLSHFLCVAESSVNDGELNAAISELAPHVHHIHARYGHEQSPQIIDPRAPEWEQHVTGFERWWETIWRSQRARKLDVSTVSPEHGPPHYLASLPYTRQPIVNLWEINSWVHQRVVQRFQQFSSNK